MYSKNNEYPDILPNRIRLNTGLTRTGGDYSEQELNDADYKFVGEKPECSSTQIVEWDTSIGEWFIRNKTEIELMSEEDKKLKILHDNIDRLIADAKWSEAADAFDDKKFLRISYMAMWNRYKSQLKILRNTTNYSDVVLPLPPTHEDVLRYHYSRI